MSTLKVVSTNIGEKKTVVWKGKTYTTGIFKYPVNQELWLGTTDVKRDHVIDRKYHGGIDKACYAFSADDYSFWEDMYPEISFTHGMFGENLTVEGMDEAEIFIGDQYRLGGALLEVSEPRQPCVKFNIRLDRSNASKVFVKHECSGVYFRVLKEGIVSSGNVFHLIKRDPHSLSVKRIFQLLFNPSERKVLEHAISIEALAESTREDLKAILQRC